MIFGSIFKNSSKNKLKRALDKIVDLNIQLSKNLIDKKTINHRAMSINTELTQVKNELSLLKAEHDSYLDDAILLNNELQSTRIALRSSNDSIQRLKKLNKEKKASDNAMSRKNALLLARIKELEECNGIFQ